MYLMFGPASDHTLDFRTDLGQERDLRRSHCVSRYIHGEHLYGEPTVHLLDVPTGIIVIISSISERVKEIIALFVESIATIGAFTANAHKKNGRHMRFHVPAGLTAIIRPIDNRSVKINVMLEQAIVAIGSLKKNAFQAKGMHLQVVVQYGPPCSIRTNTFTTKVTYIYFAVQSSQSWRS